MKQEIIELDIKTVQIEYINKEPTRLEKIKKLVKNQL